MQTVKTAVVTVLLLVVLYASYVAINTPPMMMPDEIEGMLVADPSFEIDDGAIDVPEIEVPDFGQSFAGSVNSTEDGVTASLSSDPESTSVAQSNDPPSFNADVPGGLPTLDFGNGADANVASAPGAAPLMTLALPKPNESATPVAADPTQAYPGTPMAGLSLSGPNSAPNAAPQAPTSSAPSATGDAGFQLPGLNDQAAATPPAASSTGFDNAIETADRQVAAGELREALFTLSLFHGSPDLTAEQTEKLMPRLNALAGEVVYSRRHLMESAYRVTPGDTLESIAAARRVPWQTLANINGIADPSQLTPGMELKVVTGPFRAEIDLTKSRLALFLGDLYAGSFPVRMGTSPAPVEGTFAVKDKQKARAYYGMDGTTFGAGDPRNPYGDIWLDLGNRLCIHGSPSMQPGSTGLGCLQLKTADAKDIFGLLTEGSSVTIRR